MKITDKKIIKALEDGEFIRAKSFPRNCMLQLKKGVLIFLDWGQEMNSQEIICNNFIKFIKEKGFYVCNEMGKKP